MLVFYIKLFFLSSTVAIETSPIVVAVLVLVTEQEHRANLFCSAKSAQKVCLLRFLVSFALLLHCLIFLVLAWNA